MAHYFPNMGHWVQNHNFFSIHSNHYNQPTIMPQRPYHSIQQPQSLPVLFSRHDPHNHDPERMIQIEQNHNKSLMALKYFSQVPTYIDFIVDPNERKLVHSLVYGSNSQLN